MDETLRAVNLSQAAEEVYLRDKKGVFASYAKVL